jgi:hypothetical protein
MEEIPFFKKTFLLLRTLKAREKDFVVNESVSESVLKRAPKK